MRLEVFVVAALMHGIAVLLGWAVWTYSALLGIAGWPVWLYFAGAYAVLFAVPLAALAGLTLVQGFRRESEAAGV